MTSFEPLPAARPHGLDAYLAHDFSPGGQAYNDLMSHVEGEIRQSLQQQQVYLSGPPSEVPDYMTPRMVTWYRSVETLRHQALAGVKNAFDSERMDKGGRGLLPEAEIARAQAEYVANKLSFIRGHEADNKADYEKLKSLKGQEQAVEEAYAQMRAELGDREPRVLKWPVYLTGLIGVGIAEALLNYESFASLRWASPAIALGMTILVAIAIAFASHAHGTILKQWEYYFDTDRRDISRWRAWRLFGLGTTAFTLALAAVWYARDTYLADLLTVRATIGSAPDLSPLLVIGGSLLGNVIVYVVGLMYAYFLHDANPEFPEKKSELEKLVQERSKIQNSIATQRKRSFERLGRKREKDIERINAVDTQQRRSPSYERNRQWFAALQQQDAAVQRALQDYRNAFLETAAEKGSIVYIFPNEDNEQVLLTPAQFNGKQIELKYGSV